MQKPYIKKLGEVSKFTIWQVDGKYVRDYYDIDFTNAGQPLHFKFIPDGEIWIDKERIPGEEQFLVDYVLVENRMMKKGLSYEVAIEHARTYVENERRKIDFIKKGLKIGAKEDYLGQVHKKQLKAYSRKNFKVWVVDGEIVRDLYFVDFTEGGHDKVYSFIPQNEVWLDDDILSKEVKYVLIHELHERWLMSKGWEYHKAHRVASHMEYYCRHHPRNAGKQLKEELSRKYLVKA